jgi:hypothetical protein
LLLASPEACVADVDVVVVVAALVAAVDSLLVFPEARNMECSGERLVIEDVHDSVVSSSSSFIVLLLLVYCYCYNNCYW